MANKYLRSGAGGAGTGADWANAYTTMTLAIAGLAAGDDLWVAADHAESTAGAVTLTFPGTSASPNRVICVDHTGTVPPVAADLRTTATVSTTGANGISATGNCYLYGITFNAGSAANVANLVFGSGARTAITFDSCGLVLNNSSGSSVMRFSNTSNAAEAFKLINTTLTFGSTSQKAVISACNFFWEKTSSALLGTLPTTIFTPDTGMQAICTFNSVDLSAAGSGKTLFTGGSNSIPSRYIVNRCKLDASVTVMATPGQYGGAETYINYSGSSTSFRQEKYNYSGTETIETTIVRTGGASVDGTSVAKKYVTTANVSRAFPFEAIPIAVANSTTGSNRVVTVYGIWGGGAVPTSADIWFDVIYPGSASSVLGSVVSAGPATILTAGPSWSSDSSAWGGSTTAFKMTLTLSSPQPQLAGPMYVRIYCAAVSSTFYIDPKVVLS